MKKVELDISEQDMREWYQVQKLTDQQIAEKVFGDGSGMWVKRVRKHRHRLGIESLQQIDRAEIACPLEGPLKSLLVGSMLGDGRLVPTANAARYEEQHTEKQRAYLDWKIALWGDRVSNVAERVSDYHKREHGTDVVFTTLRTRAFRELLPWYDLFYDSRESGSYGNRNNKHFRNPGIVDLVDELAFTVWYLDDGSAGHTAVFTSGHQQDPESTKTILGIFSKFGLSPRIQDLGENARQFHIRPAQMDRFKEIVAPHVPACMMHKLDFGTDNGKSKTIHKRKREYPEMLADLDQGMTYDDIAQKYGYPRQKVYQHVKAARTFCENPR